MTRTELSDKIGTALCAAEKAQVILDSLPLEIEEMKKISLAEELVRPLAVKADIAQDYVVMISKMMMELLETLEREDKLEC